MLTPFVKFKKQEDEIPFAVQTNIFLESFKPHEDLTSSKIQDLSQSEKKLILSKLAKLSILTFWNETLQMSVDLIDPVSLLKEEIAAKTGIALDQQNLIFNQKNLLDHLPLKDYTIQNGDILNLVVKIRSGGCFPGSAMLIVENLGQKAMSEIKEGDFVKTYEINKKCSEFSKVTSVIQGFNDELCRIKTMKREIKCTMNHAFWVPNIGWKAVRPFDNNSIGILKKGDFLLNNDLNLEEIQEISLLTSNGQIKVYDLSVEGNHNFFIDGVLAHNKQIFIKLPSGKTITLDVDKNGTVNDLKQHIKDKEDIPLEEQELVYAGRVLLDKLRLIDYNIQKESMIKLILKPKSGIKIYVKMVTGKTLDFNVQTSDKLEKLKQMIQQKEGVAFIAKTKVVPS